jgi:hypothetical protein
MSDPQTITVADLKVGDFVIGFPAQNGCQAVPVNSAVRDITVSPDRQARHGVRLIPIPSRCVKFQSARAGIDRPDHWTVTVRPAEAGVSSEVSDYREWMVYALDTEGNRHRFVMHGAEEDISERAGQVVAHEWPGGTVQSIESQG